MRELQEIQKQVDKKIMSNLSEEISTESIIQNKIIALDIEISEFANEIEFFKYWKKNKGKGNTIEEIADCVAFILSLANDYGYELEVELVGKTYEENNTYMYIKRNLVAFYTHRDKLPLLNILRALLRLAKSVNITYEDIVQAYLKKSQVNIQRQENKY